MASSIVAEFIYSTPPITRILTALIVLVTLLVYLHALQPHQVMYSRFYLPKLELHRLFTTFLFFGQPSIEVALHVIFFYRYSLMLESSYGRTSDYAYMLAIIMVLLLVMSSIYYVPLLGPSLSCTITYIWTRKNPYAIVQIMGFISFYAFYLPFLVPMFTLIFDGKVSMDEIVGIIVGHVVYYLQDVYPRFGKDLLKTPCWCHRLFNERGECCGVPTAAVGARRGRRIGEGRARQAAVEAEAVNGAETMNDAVITNDAVDKVGDTEESAEEESNLSLSGHSLERIDDVPENEPALSDSLRLEKINEPECKDEEADSSPDTLGSMDDFDSVDLDPEDLHTPVSGLEDTNADERTMDYSMCGTKDELTVDISSSSDLEKLELSDDIANAGAADPASSTSRHSSASVHADAEWAELSEGANEDEKWGSEEL
ncbi:Derlin-2/3 [Pancytospora philotis]|nr:Derlin-2/3 [Pancytospora philotis]